MGVHSPLISQWTEVPAPNPHSRFRVCQACRVQKNVHLSMSSKSCIQWMLPSVLLVPGRWSRKKPMGPSCLTGTTDPVVAFCSRICISHCGPSWVSWEISCTYWKKEEAGMHILHQRHGHGAPGNFSILAKLTKVTSCCLHRCGVCRSPLNTHPGERLVVPQSLYWGFWLRAGRAGFHKCSMTFIVPFSFQARILIVSRHQYALLKGCLSKASLSAKVAGERQQTLFSEDQGHLSHKTQNWGLLVFSSPGNTKRLG